MTRACSITRAFGMTRAYRNRGVTPACHNRGVTQACHNRVAAPAPGGARAHERRAGA